MLLEAKDITVCYDTAMVLSGAGLSVDTGELVGLVGPNGAGKTSLLRAIGGLVKWEQDTLKGTTYDVSFEGSIIFNGKRIDKLPSHKIAKERLVVCPERGRAFRELTVTENLKIGAYLCTDSKEVANNLARVYALFPVLKERGKQVSGTLSGGEQQMLAIGRALMQEPKLLCIDEPSTGLAPKAKNDLFQRIKEIHDSGITILLVEQDISFVFQMAVRNYVLSCGKVVAQGTGEELMEEERIRKTYFGIA